MSNHLHIYFLQKSTKRMNMETCRAQCTCRRPCMLIYIRSWVFPVLLIVFCALDRQRCCGISISPRVIWEIFVLMPVKQPWRIKAYHLGVYTPRSMYHCPLCRAKTGNIGEVSLHVKLTTRKTWTCTNSKKTGDCNVIKYVYVVALLVGGHTSLVAIITCSR